MCNQRARKSGKCCINSKIKAYIARFTRLNSIAMDQYRINILKFTCKFYFTGPR